MSKKYYPDTSEGHPGEAISPIESWARATNASYNALIELTTLPLFTSVAIVHSISGYDLNKRLLALAPEDDRGAVPQLPDPLISVGTTKTRSHTKSAQGPAA